MPLYYFHVRQGTETRADDLGIDLPDFDAAKVEAFRTAREILSEAIRFERDEVPEAIVIAADDGRELLAVPLVLVLPKTLQAAAG
jgi:hypothetical protein